MNYIFLDNGFEEIEAITTIDLLRRANIALTTVSVTGVEMVVGAHNISVKADKLFQDVDFTDAEMLILPGGATNLIERKPLCELLLKHNEKEHLIAAICAAPLVFGNRGLLDGKKATCYPGFESYLQGAEYTANLVEVDGNFITGKGPGAALEFAFAIVEKYCGIAKVQELKQGMMIEA